MAHGSGSTCSLAAGTPLQQETAGDLLTFLNVWHAWEEHKRAPKWAHRNCLNQKALLRAADIRQQLLARLHRLDVPVASCAGDMDVVKKVCTTRWQPTQMRRSIECWAAWLAAYSLSGQS